MTAASDSFAQGLVGVTLDGRYRLEAVLGEGGMGSVFRATQLAMDRKVAVKLLKPHLTSDQAALERFAREARATLKVESPHAVKILDFGVTPLGDYYMVLEYLDGRTVQRELEVDGPFSPERVAHIARQALHALGAAHARGLIHRDVKPDNLLLMRAGSDGDYTKVLDFGVAKLMQGAAGDPAQLALTAAGMVFGTPEFMSPEQACGQPLDGRSDLYSLAATMFLMLTGATLFEADSAIEWLTHHVRTPPPTLAMVQPELAAYPELDALLQRCLAKHREQRPDSAEDMARRIAELAPTLARRPANAPPRTASKPTPIHASSYVQVLRDGDPAQSTASVGAAAAPAAGAAVPRAAVAATREAPAASPRRRRTRWLGWLGGIAIASLIGVAVGLSVHRAGHNTSGARPSTAVTEARTEATAQATTEATAQATTDSGAAGNAGAPPGAAATVTGAAIAEGTPPAPVAVGSAPPAPRPRDEPVRPVRAAAPPRNPAEEEHLRSAEEAFQSNNPLRQLVEADAALHANPRSVRARYLVGDALIKSGDLDRGCSYLAAIKHIPVARTRARAAHCPGD